MPETGELQGDLAFRYRCWGQPGSEPLILLHGSGVDEVTMEWLGAAIAPQSPRIAIRGRVPQEDGWRWFERITPTRFGQDSIRGEAAAFAEFLRSLADRHGFDPRRAIFLGYSNGANLISSTMLLHPGLIERAALLRSMPVLDVVPETDLSGARMLVITGAADVTYSPFAPALVGLLRRHGAEVEDHILPAGHEFGPEDARLVQEWLAAPVPTT